MRRFRNPNFAPESLERKLNPSTVVAPVMAEVALASAPATDAGRATNLSVDYDLGTPTMMACSEEIPNRDPGHPVPGDPGPLTPPPGSSTPPDGSGDPPITPPSLPGGPGEPA